MNTKEFEEIKEKLSEAKSKKDKAQWTIDESLKKLKELGIDSIEKAKEVLEELNTNIEKNNKRIDSFFTELESTAEWDSL
jgi:2-iminoacetate synthase ThiH